MVATIVDATTASTTFWTTGNIVWVSALAFCMFSCFGFCCYVFAPGSSGKGENDSLLPKCAADGTCTKKAGEITSVKSRFGENKFQNYKCT